MINYNTLQDTENEESVVDLDLEDKPKNELWLVPVGIIAVGVCFVVAFFVYILIPLILFVGGFAAGMFKGLMKD